MKKNTFILFVGFTILYASCSHSTNDDKLAHNHKHHNREALHSHKDHPEPKSHNHDNEHIEKKHSNEIFLDHAIAHRLGVQISSIQPCEFNEIIKVSGRIISAPGDQGIASAQSAGIISIADGIVEGKKIGVKTNIASISAQRMAGGDPNATAKANLDATKRELDRLAPLHTDGIVSTKDFNAAKQAYEIALATYSGNTTGSFVSAPISGVITQILVKQGQFVESGQPIAVISKNEKLTLQADLPIKYYNFLPTIKTANFRTAYSDSIISLNKINGNIVTPSTSITPAESGYIPIYFSFDNDGTVVPGAFAEIYLIGAIKPNTIVIPTDAVTEQQGKYYAYVQIDHDCYEKRQILLGKSNGREIEVLSGIHIGDNVVSYGAIILKLAESSGAIPEGHSHNH